MLHSYYASLAVSWFKHGWLTLFRDTQQQSLKEGFGRASARRNISFG